MNMPCIEFQPRTMPTMESPPLIGLARLMTMAFRCVDLMPLAQTLITRALDDEHDANALMDLSTVLMLQGVREVGLSTQAQAIACSRLYHLAADETPALHLLAIMTPGDLMTNAPLAFLAERSDVALSMLYVQPGEPLPQHLPPHDVLWIAVSESDAVRGLLADLGAACAGWGSPTVNRPEGTLRTSRTEACAALRGLPGVCMPDTAPVDRAALQTLMRCEAEPGAWLQDGRWPLIVRPVDSHAGQGLEKVASPFELSQYLSAMPGEDFYLSRFVDYASADGQFRKFRVVLVDGVPYAGHLGVSSHWMVHYLNAGMTDSAAKRDEEARFMAEFDTRFARRHSAALQGIAERIGLDYLVIDCAETPEGELLVFEVDPGAAIHSMDSPDLFPYKVPAMEKVRVAFRALLARVAATAGQTQP
jgi:glutathione synthase/RimK-type ligase-like ATP-grasp enzyme